MIHRFSTFLALFVLLSAGHSIGRPLNMGPDTKELKTQHFRFQHRPQQETLVRKLAGQAEKARTRLCKMYVSCPDATTLIQVATDEKDFLGIQPSGAHIDWAAGVAYADLNLIILRVDRSMMLTIEETLVHEISHILLLNYAQKRPPRWFIEGLAIYQADQDLITRFEAVAAASVSDSVIPLANLTKSFPATEKGRSLAYAQSGLFVQYLVNQFGEEGIRKLIEGLHHSVPFPLAVQEALGSPLKDLENQWLESMNRYGWVKALTSQWVIWSLISILFLLALWVARRRVRRGKKRLQREEEREWDYIQ